MHMCAQRTRKVETRDEIMQQSIESLYPVKSNYSRNNQFKHDRQYTQQPRNKLIEYRQKQQKKKEAEMKNLLKVMNENSNIQSNSNALSPDTSGYDHLPAQNASNKQNLSYGKHTNNPRPSSSQSSFVLPYKPKSHNIDPDEKFVQLRIHYSKAK